MIHGRRDKPHIRTGEEQDAYTRWRKWYVYTSRPGVIKKIKRRTHKWSRRQGKNEIRQEMTE